MKTAAHRRILTMIAMVGLLVLAAGAVLAGQGDARTLAKEPDASPSFLIVSTGNPDGKMAMATCPSCGSPASEHEAADDFIVTTSVRIANATFVGLLPTAAPLSQISDVIVEIYRVFPADSNITRTIQVPTRVNSPSDVDFLGRANSANELSFNATVLSPIFVATNSVLDGIQVNSGGNGAVSGEEVQIAVTLTDPIDLAPGRYFFVPQVALSSGNFYWLSAPKPIVAPGTPFSPDLQAWIRKASLDPDWLRVGTDIVGGAPAPTFNATFSLSGQRLEYLPLIIR